MSVLFDRLGGDFLVECIKVMGANLSSFVHGQTTGEKISYQATNNTWPLLFIYQTQCPLNNNKQLMKMLNI